MPSDMPHFKLRLPQALLDRVKAAAEQEGRTATALIVEMIEDGLARRESLDDARGERRKIADSERAKATGSMGEKEFDRIVAETVRAATKQLDAHFARRLADLQSAQAAAKPTRKKR